MWYSASLEGRLKEMSNTGALFETDAAKAEIEEVKSALAEARRRPDEFVLSFEHLRPFVYTPEGEDQDTVLDRNAYSPDVPGSQTCTSPDLCSSSTTKRDLKLKEKLAGILDSLRRCEISQSCTVQKALNFQECSKFYEHYYVDDSVNAGSLSSTCKTWAALETLEIQLQANSSIEAVRSEQE